MKKLLFIGALLVAGATSFGAVSGELTGENTSASASVNLRLNTRGTVVDTTNKPIFIVTPTVNAGADGESLGFDFGSVIKGKKQTLEGKFTAEVWYKDKKLPFGTAEVDATLSLMDGTTGTGTEASIPGIELKDTTSGEKIGTLAYTLSGIETNDSTYTGTVNATVDATTTGAFNDKSTVVTVSITAFDYSQVGV